MTNSFISEEEFNPLTPEQLEEANLDTLKQQYPSSFLTALKLGQHGASFKAELEALKNDVENKVITAKEGLIIFHDITRRIFVTKRAFLPQNEWFQNQLTFDVTAIVDAVDDSAAAAAGVNVGQVYRDGSILKIRTS